MEKSWKVILAFAGVFVAGGICGGLVAMRADRLFRPAGKSPGQQAYWPQMMQRLETKLSLTAEQKETVRPIMVRTQEEVQGMRRENVANVSRAMDRMHAEIGEHLTPEQRVKLDEMRKKLRERVERERREKRDGERPAGSPRS